GCDRDTGARPEVAWRHDRRPAKRISHSAGKLANPRRASIESASVGREPRHDRHAGLRGKNLRYALVHPRRRRQHAAADIGAAAELEKALDTSILSECAVEDRDEDVNGNGVVNSAETRRER